MDIYMVAPPPKTYIFEKNIGFYSVSGTFWPLDLVSFVWGVTYLAHI